MATPPLRVPPSGPLAENSTPPLDNLGSGALGRHNPTVWLGPAPTTTNSDPATSVLYWSGVEPTVPLGPNYDVAQQKRSLYAEPVELGVGTYEVEAAIVRGFTTGKPADADGGGRLYIQPCAILDDGTFSDTAGEPFHDPEFAKVGSLITAYTLTHAVFKGKVNITQTAIDANGGRPIKGFGVAVCREPGGTVDTSGHLEIQTTCVSIRKLSS